MLTMDSAMKIAFLVLLFVLGASGCSYNTKTGETKFDPFSYEKSLINDAKRASSGCSQDGKDCRKRTSHENYEASKIKAMSNEELEIYAKDRK